MSNPTAKRAGLYPSELRVLRYLKNRLGQPGGPWVSPSDIGWYATGYGDRRRDRRQWQGSNQGAGRVGGALASKLVRQGLAQLRPLGRRGEPYAPAYRITQRGRQVLEQAEADTGAVQ